MHLDSRLEESYRNIFFVKIREPANRLRVERVILFCVSLNIFHWVLCRIYLIRILRLYVFFSSVWIMLPYAWILRSRFERFSKIQIAQKRKIFTFTVRHLRGIFLTRTHVLNILCSRNFDDCWLSQLVKYIPDIIFSLWPDIKQPLVRKMNSWFIKCLEHSVKYLLLHYH